MEEKPVILTSNNHPYPRTKSPSLQRAQSEQHHYASKDSGHQDSSPNYHNYSSQTETDASESEERDAFIEIKVQEPHKVGEGISSFMAYRMITKTNLSFFKRQEFVVSRRFSDFLGLHEKLTDKYLCRGRVVPPAPEKSLIATTKVKMSTNGNSNGNNEGSEASNGRGNGNEEFITRRRFALERFINRVAQHPTLRRDNLFVEFLETVRDLPRATSTSALSSASVFRLLGKVGDTVNKMTYKMEETDPWYVEKIQNIDLLENYLKKLYSLTETLVQYRQDLSLATGLFSVSTAMLANAEEAHSLSRALAQLSRVEEQVEQAHRHQTEADNLYLFDLIKDYVALVGAVKEVLAERGKAFQNWQHAQSMVIKKKEQKARLEMGGKLDKIPSANEEVLDWENRLVENQQNFNRISEVIKGEIELFERYRIKDFKVAMIQYLEALMSCQLEIVKNWEEFLPEVKTILS